MTIDEFIKIETALVTALEIISDNNNLNLTNIATNALRSEFVSRSVLRLAGAIETLKSLPECEEFVSELQWAKVL